MQPANDTLHSPDGHPAVQHGELPFSSTLSPRRIVELYVGLIRQELSFRRDRELDDSYLARKYEPALFSRLGRHNHLAVRGYAARLSHMVSEIRRLGSPRMLDAGSGIGSESILAALLDADVTAMDLAAAKTAYAISRIPYYEGVSRRSLRLRFLTGDVIDHLRASPMYDAIWVNEAISHIHPAEEFIVAAFNGLRPGGVLLIADANANNPVARWRATRLRQNRHWFVSKRCKFSDEILPVDVADERLFTSGTLTGMLLQAGFRVRLLDVHGFMGSFFLPPSWQFNPLVGKTMALFQEAAKRVPLLRRCGSSMSVIAEKGARS
jgi:2-polyprenyl-3-methyl-5-hydroxy-6-metoxy-1,4-benzoquinol methylase